METGKSRRSILRHQMWTHGHMLMKVESQRMLGLEKKIRCERNLRNRLSISLRIGLLNPIDKLELVELTISKLLLSQTNNKITMTVTVIQQTNQRIKRSMVQVEVLPTQLKFNSTLLKLKKLNK